MPTRLLNFRVTEEERDLWHATAREHGMSLSAYIRYAVNLALAQKEVDRVEAERGQMPGSPTKPPSRATTKRSKRTRGTTATTESRPALASCADARKHRAGAYCKTCGGVA